MKELAARGIKIYSVIRENADHTEDLCNAPNITLVHCDMADYQQLPEMLPDAAIDVFYHFAWEGSAGALRANETTQLHNIRCSCDAVRASKALGCEKFIFVSSIMEYEITALMAEERTPPASSIYCSAKIAANYMCRAVSGALGIVYIPAVISNIYGPGERSPRLVNTSIRKLLKKEHTSFSSGEQLYDFVYITDAAKMFAEIGVNYSMVVALLVDIVVLCFYTKKMMDMEFN